MSNTAFAPPSELLRTPLYDSHVKLGAKMVPFAGFDMPVSYPLGTVGEVKACRTEVGLFDVSHMGEVMVNGPDSVGFLNFATTNDIHRLRDNEAQYSLLLNYDGTVIDDIIVYRFNAASFLIVVNASRQHEDFARFKEIANSYNVRVEDQSSSKGLIAVQGPKAVAQIINCAGRIPSERFSFADSSFFGADVLISRTGYTGEDGVEILCDSPDAHTIWNKLIELGGVPCGLGARDVLRLEAGYPLYGHELDEEHSPQASGVGWVVKMDKTDFAGRDALIKSGKPEYKLVGLKAVNPANAIPRQGCIVEANGNEVGVVTSGTLSPLANAGIALARVKSEFAKFGTQLTIDIRGRKIGTEVVRTPFVTTSLTS